MIKKTKSVQLNNVFYPNKTYDLIRIGKSNDGGYLVEKNSFNESKFLIGFGINEDWSFETKFGKPFIGIDNQISFNFLFKKFLYLLFWNIIKFYQLTRLKSTIRYFKKLTSYMKLRKNFINGWIYGPYDSNINYKLGDLLNSVKNNVFLKVDIEGSEYRMLDEILELENKLTGIVIEFHDFDVHHQLVKNFIEKTQMKLCHVHVNNYCKIYNGFPTLIEFTFSKNPNILSDSKPIFPHNLDQPNNPMANEIIVS
jgi:hypothetical protein